MLGLELENPSTFKVAAAKCGAGDDISCEGLELRPDVQLAPTVGTKGLLRPSADKLFAACRERRQHELQCKVTYTLQRLITSQIFA